MKLCLLLSLSLISVYACCVQAKQQGVCVCERERGRGVVCWLAALAALALACVLLYCVYLLHARKQLIEPVEVALAVGGGD